MENIMKDNPNYKLYLAGLLTESEYFDIIEGRGNTIKAKDPVRNAVASIQNYWKKPGMALTKIQGILHDHGYVLGGVPSFSVHDKSPQHTQRFSIEKLRDVTKPEESDPVDNMLIFSWHWISENQCEITAYIA